MAISRPGSATAVEWSASASKSLTSGAPSATSDAIAIPAGVFGVSVTMETDNAGTPTLDTENCRHFVLCSPDGTNYDDNDSGVAFPLHNTNIIDPKQSTIAIPKTTRSIKIYSESDVAGADQVDIAGFVDWKTA